jgi:hypothetical protein
MRKKTQLIISAFILLGIGAIGGFLLLRTLIGKLSLNPISHTQSTKKPPYNREDAEFIQKVETAVEKSVPPEKIEQFVGQEAFINTWRPEPEYALGRWGIDEDVPPPAPVIRLRTAKKVMVWRRPVEAEDHYPRVVGILWGQNDKETVFTGLLLPQ